MAEKVVRFVKKAGSLEKAIFQFEERRRELEKAVRAYERKIMNLKSDVSALETKKMALIRENEDLQTEIREHEARLTEIQSKEKATRKMLASWLGVHENTSELMQAIRTKNAELASLNAAILEAEEKLEGFENERMAIKWFRGLLLREPDWGFDYFWREVETLRRIRKGVAPHLKNYEESIEEGVRRHMIDVLVKGGLKYDMVSKWKYEQLRAEKQNLERKIMDMVPKTTYERVVRLKKDLSKRIARQEKEKRHLEERMESLETFIKDPDKLTPEQKEVVKEWVERYHQLKNFGLVLGETITGALYPKIKEVDYVCDLCHRTFSVKLRTRADFHLAISSGKFFEVKCSYCGHKNLVDPNLLLRNVGWMALPK